MLALVAALLVGSAVASPLVTIESRDVIGNLPSSAPSLDSQFQPLMDFDTDSCYYTSAIDSSGKCNPGLPTPWGKGVSADCRNINRLNSNNVYSRSRCNNGICAVMYEYYFEKDQAVWGSYLGGHQHEWENVVIFARGSDVIRVAPSCHGKYDNARSSDFPKDGSRAKVVYHKDGIGTHCFRIANADDERIENDTGRWFLGNLVGWNSWPSVALRDKLISCFSGGVGPKLTDNESKFVNNLRTAAGSAVPGFNPEVDG